MHTPGPWKTLKDHDRETVVSEKVNKYGNFIVTIVTRGDNEMTNEDRDNALLIAAAPELLTALEKLLGFAKMGGAVEALEQAHTAIRKAKGE
jgi:hypothetical protein